MRKNKAVSSKREFSILALDDDQMMTLTLQSYFQTSGYTVDTENNPEQAIQRIKEGTYDILLLDFLMTPICGDEVVARIREFNKELFIILLTGHKSLAPPIQTIRDLDIQGYYEKSERFDQLELLVESCTKSIRQMRTIGHYRDSLRAVVDCTPDLYKLQPIEALPKVIWDHMENIFSSMDGFVLIRREGQAPALPKDYFFGGGRYCDGLSQAQACLQKGFSFVAQAVPKLDAGMLTMPFLDEGQHPLGVLAISPPKSRPIEDLSALFALYVRQASAAISNALLHDLVRKKNQELDQAYQSLHGHYLDMTQAVRSMVDARDIYTRGHSDRVSEYSQRIAKAMGMGEDVMERVRIAGLFHDIGKVGIPDQILLKNSRLTPEEYAVIKRHPSQGEQILAAVGAFRHIAPIVACHHERIDGKGYPNGLTGAQIPLESRIISVADAFDAMTSHRRYRDNLTLGQAIDQLKQGRGTQFDPDVVDAFLPLLENFEALRQELAWTYTEQASNSEA